MRQALSVALLQFRLVLKSKGTVVTMFGLPLLMTLIFGTLVGGNSGSGDSGRSWAYPVAVVDRDGSFASRKLVEALQGEPALKVRLAGEEELTRLFADRKIDSGVVIPPGFGKELAGGRSPEVLLVTSPYSNDHLGVGPAVRRQAARLSEDYRLARRMIGDLADERGLQEAYARVSAERRALGISVSQERLTRTEAKAQDRLANVGERALGFTVMFVMMIVFMMSGVILHERQNGTWGRLLTTPASRASLVSGYLLSFFLTGMFQFAVLVAASRLLFGVNWGPLLPLAVMAAALVLCSASLGLFLAGIVRTYEQQQTAGILVVNATSLLGGVFWPLEFVGDTMRRIGYLTPQAWAMDGFREVMLRGGSWSNLVWPLTVLLAVAAIFAATGLLRVRYE